MSLELEGHACEHVYVGQSTRRRCQLRPAEAAVRTSEVRVLHVGQAHSLPLSDLAHSNCLLVLVRRHSPVGDVDILGVAGTDILDLYRSGEVSDHGDARTA